jgi:hypothetical protein
MAPPHKLRRADVEPPAPSFANLLVLYLPLIRIGTAVQETRSNILMGVIRSSFGPAEFTK